MVAQPQRRQSRFDRWGNIWCHACERFLVPARFSYTPRKSGNSYPLPECRDCRSDRHKRYMARLAQDAERYRRMSERDHEARKKRSAERRAEQRELAQSIIQRLIDRGFTVTEIAQLCRAHPSSIRAWLRGEWDIKATSLERLTGLMQAAMDVQPVLPAPRSINQQCHHPDFWRVLAQLEGHDE